MVSAHTIHLDQELLTHWQGHRIRIRLLDGTELRPGVLTRFDDSCLMLTHVESDTQFIVYRSAIAVIEE